MSLSSRMSTEFWLKSTKTTAFRNVKPISSVEVRGRFGDTYCLHFHSRIVVYERCCSSKCSLNFHHSTSGLSKKRWHLRSGLMVSYARKLKSSRKSLAGWWQSNLGAAVQVYL
jgi:hypothetical protein